VGSFLAAGRTDGVVGVVERPAHPLLVEHLEALDALVAIDDEGLWRLDPAALDAEAVPRPIDPLTPLHLVCDLPDGDRVGGPDDVATWRREGALLTAALALGIAEATTDQAVAYAKEREQFDKPIGAFQAVKHLCADMLTRAEVARATVYAAGVTADGRGGDDVDRLVAAAKITAGEAARANGKACIQVHGGMGFTWEVDAHLYLKRALVLDTVFGSVDDHAEAVAQTL
jgi:alkylation response protein AidB-like acyl-CoA dehydrogenase